VTDVVRARVSLTLRVGAGRVARLSGGVLAYYGQTGAITTHRVGTTLQQWLANQVKGTFYCSFERQPPAQRDIILSVWMWAA